MTDDDLTLLGRTVRGPVTELETFEAPPGCARVRFVTREVTSVCPVTGQPDISTVLVEYTPRERCIESKSLKLYLWHFRDRALFAETLAVEVADEVERATSPGAVRVTVTQHARGGIVTEVTAERGDIATLPLAPPPVP